MEKCPYGIPYAAEDLRMSLTFLHTGDYGDIIASLPVIRAMGGGTLVLAPHERRDCRPREQMTEDRARFLIPLIGAQPYIDECRWEPKTPEHDFDFSTVRRHPKPRTETLVDWHGRVVGMSGVDVSPWLQVDSQPHRQIVINRTRRYRNQMFPWNWIFHTLSDRSVFVGTPGEHLDVKRIYKCNIEHFRARDAAILASKIAGAPIFVGNQSFCCWLAMGIGQRVIQETFRPIPDSRIERPGSWFIGDSRKAREACDILKKL